jgi:predicted alpha/beta-hydrolase family hydrolase
MSASILLQFVKSASCTTLQPAGAKVDATMDTGPLGAGGGSYGGSFSIYLRNVHEAQTLIDALVEARNALNAQGATTP